MRRCDKDAKMQDSKIEQPLRRSGLRVSLDDGWPESGEVVLKDRKFQRCEKIKRRDEDDEEDDDDDDVKVMEMMKTISKTNTCSDS